MAKLSMFRILKRARTPQLENTQGLDLPIVSIGSVGWTGTWKVLDLSGVRMEMVMGGGDILFIGFSTLVMRL